MELKSALSLTDICQELGLSPQFLLDLAQHSAGFYRVFDQQKRSGGLRTISAPHGQLKTVQRTILDGLLSKVPFPSHVHGCVRGRSIVSNARGHTNQEVVVNVDLSDFFGTISFARVAQIFQEKFKCDKQASETLAQLTTYHNRLPQGAPSSPALANLSALELDDALIRICAENIGSANFHYSRYVDDITISGGAGLLDLLPKLFDAIETNGFRTNSKKTRILRQSTRQWVTGVVVNKKPNPPRKLIRKVRQHLYYCHKYGMTQHCESRGIKPSDFVDQINGLVGYIRMTQPHLADEFALLLREVIPRPIKSKDESTLNLLKEIIDAERLASFIYEETHRKVVPTDIVVDDDGFLLLRAFQLSPEQRWESFLVFQIDDLKSEGNSLS
jgi:RNA-directed DNA polymerase